MSNGFSFITGSGSTVTMDSDDPNVPGVYIDLFYVPYTGSVTRTYSNLPGNSLFALTFVSNDTKLNSPTIAIDNSSKTVTVSCPSTVIAWLQTGVYVIIMGR